MPTILNYVKETGDFAFIDEVIPYADGGNATVYEHMMAALDFSAEYVGKPVSVRVCVPTGTTV